MTTALEFSSSSCWRLREKWSVLERFPDAVLIGCMGRNNWVRWPDIDTKIDQIFNLRGAVFTRHELEQRLNVEAAAESDGSNFEHLINKLHKAGVLTSFTEQVSKGTEPPIFFKQFATSSEQQKQMISKLRATQLRIVSSYPIPRRLFEVHQGWWKSIVVTDQPDAGQVDDVLNVFIFDAGWSGFAAQVNTLALARRALILPVMRDAFSFSIGPVSCIPQTPCLFCTYLRQQSMSNGSVDKRQIAGQASSPVRPLKWPGFFWSTLAGSVMTEAVNIVSDCVSGATRTAVINRDFINHRAVSEAAYAVPRCPACQPAIDVSLRK